MIYSLKFIYNDGKDLVINITEDKLKEFFESLNTRQMYFDENNVMGFWTDLDKIRYVQAFKVGEPNEPQASPSPSEVPAQDAATPCCA